MTPLPPPETGPPRVPQPPPPPGGYRTGGIVAPPPAVVIKIEGDITAEQLATIKAALDSTSTATNTETLEALPAGLDPEQEIRDRAADIAASLLGYPRANLPGGIAHQLITLAEPIADWIRDGS